ncbi:MAG TPA: amidohydrolase family protein [Candidatus Dormibacteraeota bacterium]|nr:amidohydrolase family protein [Candidatus Dormibacteraeota bacterium]
MKDEGAPQARVIPDRSFNFLANARREVERRGLDEVPVVDCDCHLYETTALPEIVRYIDNPNVRRSFERSSLGMAMHALLPGNLGDRTVSGRIKTDLDMHLPTGDRAGIHPLAAGLLHSMDQMAIDYSILFPTPMLTLGTHPQPEVEVELARAYNRWLVRDVLVASPRIRTMAYLPLSNPEASVDFIEEFAGAPGVLGFMVTAVRYQPIHENRFVKVFAALDERSLPLAFHSGPNWSDRPFEQLNRFLSAHALGFPFYAMLQLTNLVVNGLPERFPNVRFIFMEAGQAWVPFLVARLDNEYRQRSSEAPLLRRLPSAYIQEMFFTTQPFEPLDDPEHMRTMIEMMGGPSRLLYSSDYPHQDFDLPTMIWDLPFLSEEARRDILGGNAMRLFGLPAPERKRPAGAAPAAAPPGTRTE